MSQRQTNSGDGHIYFLPWVALPRSHTVLGLEFCPVEVALISDALGNDAPPEISKVLQQYTDQSGQTIHHCTIVLRPRAKKRWDIPLKDRSRLEMAVKVLAFACLAEQRFFEGFFSPHLNSSMFKLFGQPISTQSERISLRLHRRGMPLLVGGLKFTDLTFQQPTQAAFTECKIVPPDLLRSISVVARSNGELWHAAHRSIDLFLLAHSESPDVPADTAVMLAAMGFEQLLRPNQRTAQGLAEAFSLLWQPYSSKTLIESKSVKPDEKYNSEQANWAIHRKWMKELYESRSASAHLGVKNDFSRNWRVEQHLIISAFVFPLCLKKKLSQEGLYELTDDDIGSMQALDELLESGFKKINDRQLKWPEILSSYQSKIAFRRVIGEAVSRR